MSLITAKEVVGKLKQGGTADISTAYFSKLVTTGVIPFHTIPGKKRKMFDYEEAKKALIRSQDPSRQPQREANALAKENKKLNDDLTRLKQTENTNERTTINDRYREAQKWQTALSSLSKEDHFKMLEANKEMWAHENIDECYKEDIELTSENNDTFMMIHSYLDDFEEQKPKTVQEVDFIIKKILVNYLLDQDWYSIDLDKLKEKEG